MNVMKTMKRIRWAALPLLLLGVACDDGKIYETYQPMEEQGSVYQLTATLRGVDTWPADYELVAAAFGDSPYAIYTKVIHAPAREGETIRVVLSGMREVNQVEICAVNRLRKRIVTFFQTDFTLQEDSVLVDNCGKKYMFPRMDVRMLDVPTTTAEEMSKMMAEKLVNEIKIPENVRSLSVGLDEERGQTAWYTVVLQ